MRRLFRRSTEAVRGQLEEWVAGRPCAPDSCPPEHVGPLDRGDGVPVVPLGRSFPIRLNGRWPTSACLSTCSSRLERILVGGGFDLVHVHEPVAPSLSFTAIREARNPVMASFHPTPWD